MDLNTVDVLGTDLKPLLLIRIGAEDVNVMTFPNLTLSKLPNNLLHTAYGRLVKHCYVSDSHGEKHKEGV